jgi:hypothetical protein
VRPSHSDCICDMLDAYLKVVQDVAERMTATIRMIYLFIVKA